jgi:mRNA-degrading endonuclease RelE of RelBE toxin-antitoxin system
MNVKFTEHARKEFLKLDKQMQIRFKEAIIKITEFPDRKHLIFGLPYYVINVTKQARLIYEVQENTLFILHCFSTHKNYEKWYRGF